MATKDDLMLEMQKQIDNLRSQLADITGRKPIPSDNPEDRPDYVKRGSDKHASMMGLRKADAGETLEDRGWTFEDVTQYGPMASIDYLQITLQQKVNELTSKLPETQSVDPRQPHFAPTIWTPMKPFSEITEN